MNWRNLFGNSLVRCPLPAFHHYFSLINHFWTWFCLLIFLSVAIWVSSSAESDLITGLAYLGFFLLFSLFSMIVENIGELC